jgi:Tfp pilus assembly protein FimV
VRHSGTYRRRRLGALLAVSAVVYILYANAGADAGTTPVSYTVEYGDTLWEVATGHYPSSEDPRAVIEAIRQVNDLEGYGLRPGMRLELPARERRVGPLRSPALRTRMRFSDR